jgi:hypothetical protein
MAKSPVQIAHEAQQLAASDHFDASKIHFDKKSVGNGVTAKDFAQSVAAGHGSEADALSLLSRLAEAYFLDPANVLVQFATDIAAVPGHAGDASAIGLAIAKLVSTGKTSVALSILDVANAFASSKLPPAQAFAMLNSIGAGDYGRTATSFANDIGDLVPQPLSADAAVALLLAMVQAASGNRGRGRRSPVPAARRSWRCSTPARSRPCSRS